MQTEATRTLLNYAQGNDWNYDGFEVFISNVPQRHGLDEKLLEWVENNPGCNDEDILIHYRLMAAGVLPEGNEAPKTNQWSIKPPRETHTLP